MAFGLTSSVQARKLPEIDVVGTAAPSRAATNNSTSVRNLVRPLTEAQIHERFNVPTFLWASHAASEAGLTAARASLARKMGVASIGAAVKLSAEDVARAHLGVFRAAYNLAASDISDATVAHVHDIGHGAIVVQFQQQVAGIEVFNEQARVIMNRDLSLVAISGFISPTATAASTFKLGPVDAASIAFSDLSGTTLAGGAMQGLGALEGGYEAVDLAPAAKSGIAGATTQPARVKPVYFHTTDAMIPAWFVEVDSAIPGGSDMYAYVISAQDGSTLFRHDLTAYDAAPNSYTYRVWAFPPTDGNNPSQPFDGPHGNNMDPHPTGTLSGVQPIFTPQNDVTQASSVYSDDPWLPIGSTVTTGNNVDAYVDLVNPDGFTPNSADFRADITGPNAFQRTYDPTQPNSVNQQKAAIVQMFYNNNFFHDWYYVSGFTEAAGNAQTNNYGRGGLGNDSIKAEGQDSSGRNNANMQTPSDGGRPRMQMFLFDGIGDRHFFNVSGAPSVAADFATGVPSGFGIIGHDVTGEVVWLNDGIGSATYPPATTTVTTVHDGCDFNIPTGATTDPHWANVVGKIAFIDRGGTSANPQISCGFQVKAFHALEAGAIGVIIASTTPHNAPAPITMGAGTTGQDNGVVTIPTYQLSTPDGDAIRALFGPDGRGVSGPIIMRMVRAAVPDRDGTIDNQIMAHEWGHYISNRLIGNATGLSTNMSGGMGEGWGDTHAMLLTVKQEDAAVPANLAYNGVYGLAIWTSVGGVNGPLLNNGAYFGIRRVPYSTDMTKDPLTYQHIQDHATQPPGVPVAFWPAQDTTAANGGNSEVHNTGEVWATMLWECYASLLRDTVGPNPRLTFAEARNRWKDYLVAAYKMTPPQPTFLEARDAVLAAAYAGGDLNDYDDFLKAFAKRGAGFGATSPDRYTGTNNGVGESFVVAPNLAFVSGAITDDGTSCDKDGVLDSGESGHLAITLRNDSGQFLSGTTATVTAVGPNAANLSFPGGATVTFPASAPGETTVASVQVALASGLTGVQPMDFQVAYSDPSLADLGTQTVSFSQRGNFDDVVNQSFTDDAESATTLFTQTTLLGPGIGPDNVPFGWSRNTITAYDHNYKAAAVAVQSDIALVSPAFTVGVGPFSLSFQHRYNWQIANSAGTISTVLTDGGVVEISTDGGTTWVDITSLAGATVTGQNYTGTLNGATPLGRRPGFARQSPGYPTYVTTTITVPSALAGLAAQVRFRMGTDAASRSDGWEIDNIATNGAVTRPFRSLLPNKCNAAATPTQPNRRPTVSISAQAAVAEGTTVSLTGTGADADGDPLTWFWGQQTGPAVTITTPDPLHPEKISFVAPEITAAASPVSVTITATVFDGTAFSTVATRAFNVTNVDKPPVPSAGPSQTVNEGALVVLTAAASTDPDGDALSFAWTQTAGPAANLINANTVSPVFLAPNVPVDGATLTFSVAVTANGVTRSATVDIIDQNVTNAPPTITAGPDQTVDERTAGQLHAVANDPDGDPLKIIWTQVSPPEPVVALSGDPSPTFTAPEVTADTTFTFQVTASDGVFVASATTHLTVRNVNQAPIAVASASPLAVQEHLTATLDGTASFDPDGQGLTYSWTAVSGLPDGASIDNADQAMATFNAGDVSSDTQVTIALVVNDGFADSAPAMVTLTVLNVDGAPVASASGPSDANSGDVATLDGSGSSDPDGDYLTYSWTQTGGPSVDLSSSSAKSPTFTAPDVTGTATVSFTLQVSDGTLLSNLSTVSVTIHGAAPATPGPVAAAGVNVTTIGGETVKLSAAGSTGTGLTFAWTQVSPASPVIALDSTTSATPSFSAPTVAADTDFVFAVTVTDSTGNTATAQVTVSVKHLNNVPTLTGGTFVEVASGASVTLDGGTATDLDSGDTLTYAWTQISGSTIVTLNGANTQHPTFTAPAVTATTVLGFQLTVTDGHGGTVTTRTSVTVDAPAATTPTPPVTASSGGCSSGGGTSSFAGLFVLMGMMMLRRRKTA